MSTPGVQQPTVAPPRPGYASHAFRRAGLACSLAFLGVFGLDALVFRTHYYTQFLEPDSSTGQFEMILRREQQAQQRYGDNMIAAFGDSRLGFSPRAALRLRPNSAYVFRVAGMAGTDVRVWYYMLRDLDPTARRYRALVFAVNDYRDEDWGIPEDDPRLLHYVIARLRVSDIPGFFTAFGEPKLRWEAFRGSVFKGLVYQTDVLAFLSDPARRIKWVRLYDKYWQLWVWNWVDTDRNMVGLRIDWTAWKATLPPGMDQHQRDTVRDFLMYPPGHPQTGHYAAFRRKWFGKIIDRYRGSPTKIIFFRLARGPIPRPDNLVDKKTCSICELARRPNVLLAPEHDFDSLEHPEFYKDAMHLNREGGERFTAMLVDEVTKLLGPPGAQGTAK
jgi:hypothetical protein